MHKNNNNKKTDPQTVQWQRLLNMESGDITVVQFQFK